MQFASKAIKWLISLLLLAFCITEAGVIYSSWTLSPRKSDCIIIMGCRVYGTTPSAFLMARMNEGLRLYKNNYGKYIIVSGGRGPGEKISEAQCMKEYLISHGVSEKDVIIEDKSTNTLQNIHYSKKLMRINKLNTAVVVSNAFHLRRISRIAKREDLNATYSGAWLNHFIYWPRQAYGYVRETAALWEYDLLYQSAGQAPN